MRQLEESLLDNEYDIVKDESVAISRNVLKKVDKLNGLHDKIYYSKNQLCDAYNKPLHKGDVVIYAKDNDLMFGIITNLDSEDSCMVVTSQHGYNNNVSDTIDCASIMLISDKKYFLNKF